ncbi:MAG: hypothetical protein IEMM0002_0930 [bacterium]|nr:MAG: hypothetical protein IEMM0002_0930 [bacterium]
MLFSLKEKNENSISRLAKLTGKTVYAARRLIPSYILCFAPFLFFGTKSDIRLILWKIAVVGTGLLVFHFARKSMFPYIDLDRSFNQINQADEKSRLPLAIKAFAEAVLVASMAFAILFSVAGGI